MRGDAVTCQATSSNPDRLRVKSLDVDAAGRLLAFRTADTELAVFEAQRGRGAALRGLPGRGMRKPPARRPGAQSAGI
ncbi:hypothetical protein RIDGECB_91 [Mycobacterium phage RidgeCB]|uniref:Uncharacterized protein n=1 Tax=Mycobacterium phage RidgeCB TaxID=1071506 RepID=G1JTZ1_9CAUD|nr:hypothetical protein RIDGECB_91 [Mycobacterium phage RidgeCB]AEL20193.1 hypothetical protein RIDGECB_91 [Mycobacterium phage RidgeCB]